MVAPSSPAVSRRKVCVLLLALMTSALVLGAMFWVVGDHRLGSLDSKAFALLAASPHGMLARVAEPAAVLGPLVLAVVVLTVVVLLVRRRSWIEAAVVATGFLLCVVAARVAKFETQRPRPSGSLLHAGGFSFPSTDSAISVGLIAVAVAIARLTSERPDWTRQAAAVAAGGALTVGAGLLFVALRVHYLTDVIAGWALGAVAFAICGLAALGVRRLSTNTT